MDEYVECHTSASEVELTNRLMGGGPQNIAASAAVSFRRCRIQAGQCLLAARSRRIILVSNPHFQFRYGDTGDCAVCQTEYVTPHTPVAEFNSTVTQELEEELAE